MVGDFLTGGFPRDIITKLKPRRLADAPWSRCPDALGIELRRSVDQTNSPALIKVPSGDLGPLS